MVKTWKLGDGDNDAANGNYREKGGNDEDNDERAIDTDNSDSIKHQWHCWKKSRMKVSL